MNRGNQKHLLIAYSWSTENIGDVAITTGLLNLLRDHHPEWPVVVYTRHREEEPPFAYLKTYLPKYHPNCRVVGNPIAPISGDCDIPLQPGSAWRRFHDRWGEAKLHAFQSGCLAADQAEQIAEEIREGLCVEMYVQLKKENPAAADAIGNAGFVLLNSGTVLNFGRLGVRDFFYYAMVHAMPLMIARKLHIPYGMNAHSFDAIDWPASLVFRPLFKDAEFVFCRDSDSLEYLRQRNLENPTTGYRPDSTFFNLPDGNAKDETWANEFMSRHGLTDREFITLTIRQPYDAYDLKEDKNEKTMPAVKPNAPDAKFHADTTQGALSRERREHQMKKLRSFIEAWVEATNLPVVLAPEVRIEIRQAYQYLYARLSETAKSRCVCMDQFWTPEQAYALYRRAQTVISMEMHSIIMALSIGTPVLHVPYRECGRKSRMMEDLGLGEWLLDIDEIRAEDLLAAARNIREDYPAALAKVTAPSAKIKALGADVMEHIRKARITA